MHRCMFCPYITDSIKSLGFHLTGCHMGVTFQGAPRRLGEGPTNREGLATVNCWCGYVCQLELFGLHLEERGWLEGHLLEIVLGYKHPNGRF